MRSDTDNARVADLRTLFDHREAPDKEKDPDPSPPQER